MRYKYSASSRLSNVEYQNIQTIVKWKLERHQISGNDGFQELPNEWGHSNPHKWSARLPRLSRSFLEWISGWVPMRSDVIWVIFLILLLQWATVYDMLYSVHSMQELNRVHGRVTTNDQISKWRRRRGSRNKILDNIAISFRCFFAELPVKIIGFCWNDGSNGDAIADGRACGESGCFGYHPVIRV